MEHDGGDGPTTLPSLSGQHRSRLTIPPSRARSLPALTAIAASLALGGCGDSVLQPIGPIGAAERTMMLNAVVIMLAIIVPTMIATVAFAWWFRAGNTRARYRPDWAFSGGIEILVWSIPLLTIVFLGGIAWIGSHDVDPNKPIESSAKPLEIQVVALDWKWLFIYPEQKVAAVNQLFLPVNTPVHFSMTSATVWNSFYVPRLGSMIYVMNGMATQMHLMADQEGKYFGLSTHFSGDGFAKMIFAVNTVPEQSFQDWVRTTQADGPVLDGGAYQELAKQSSGVPPSTFKQVEPGLFSQIVNLEQPPGPGPVPSISPK